MEEAIETAEVSAAAPEKPQGIGTALALGLAFALCGTLIALRDFAIQVLPHILMPDDISRFQEISDGYPLPKVLDWNSPLIDFLVVLRAPNPVLGLAVALGLGLVLWIVTIALLNPTFRPIGTAHSPNDPNPASVQPFDKAFRIFVRLALPVAALWVLISKFLPSNVGFALQLTFLIFGMSVGYRTEGMAGDFASPNFNHNKIPLGKFFDNALLFGVLLALIRAQLPKTLAPTLELYQMLGTFHRGYLNAIAAYWFWIMGVLWFIGGILLFGIGRIAAPPRLRLLAFLLGLIGIVVAIISGQNLRPEIHRKHFDARMVEKSILVPYNPEFPNTGISTGLEGAILLANRLGIPFRDPKLKPPTHNLVVFDQMPLFARLSAYTDDGQPLDADSLKKIADYYESNNGLTAHNWNAMRWQMSAASAQFDNAKILELCLQDLTNAPHVSRTPRVARELFFTCAANSRNLASLDKWADERNFAFPDRDSLHMMGDLYRRFGNKNKALSWYRRAEMPQSFLKLRQEEKPMFRQGTVRGTLTFNGKPLAGVLVGVLPRRLNGLPRDIEGSLFNAMNTIVPRFRYRRRAEATSSFAFRWISASAITDAQGKFEMKDLTEGEYVFVATLSPQKAPKHYNEQFIQAQNTPRPFVLNYTHATQDLGTVPFRISNTKLPAENVQ